MHTFQAMSTEFRTIGLSAHSQRQAESWFSFIEKSLSRFRESSELSALNRSEGRPFLASALLYQATSVADRYFRETGGLFNPYVGRALVASGYSDSLESAKRTAHVANNAAAVPGTPEEPAELDRRMMGIRLHPDVSLDLGGIAKGWSAEQLAGMLQREGVRVGAIDAGGDLALWGTPEGGWEIAIGDPFAEERELAHLRLKRSAGIATSSVMKRRWGAAGSERHHLIDPRTMKPADTDLAQVTVLAPTLTEAEVYAKCLLLLGAEVGMAWLEARKPAFGYVAVGRDGQVFRGGALADYEDADERTGRGGTVNHAAAI
ncbi:FAD:protein FMN transferase [Cohnella fermenti]|nr:FAD:protein FMN transferase [Cohnella fermenti]